MNPARREFLYWNDIGLRRILCPLTDFYSYWLATTDPVERTYRKKLKEFYGGDLRRTLDTLVEVTHDCETPKERKMKLGEYISKLEESSVEVEKEKREGKISCAS